MEHYSDTDIIVAPATPRNIRSPLAIIRVSGAGCHQLIQSCFRPRTKQTLQPWRTYYGDWFDEQGMVDDVTLTPFAAPRSYTGQEMFEIFCHGNPMLVEAVIESLLARGGRMARPGEFTMRAVLNGKMDLLQAEGVNGILEAHTRYQADMVRRQAHGPLVKFIQEQVEEILQVQSHIEATIDYGEEDVDALDRERLSERLVDLLTRFSELHQTAKFANTMRRGFKVLLTGEPNVGKSTLFNALVRQERAIVTHLPGTTRDLISEEIEIQGLPVVLLDSAGVRETTDEIEHIGIEKIFAMLDDVDLVLFLTEDGKPAQPYPKLLALPEHKWMTVYTKSDLKNDEKSKKIRVSAATGQGMPALERELVIRLSHAMDGRSVYLINQRQEQIIGNVIEQLQIALETYTTGFGEEILSSYLNTARGLLGELTGDTTVEDILDRMFSNFCLGK